MSTVLSYILDAATVVCNDLDTMVNADRVTKTNFDGVGSKYHRQNIVRAFTMAKRKIANLEEVAVDRCAIDAIDYCVALQGAMSCIEHKWAMNLGDHLFYDRVDKALNKMSEINCEAQNQIVSQVNKDLIESDNYSQLI